MSTQDKRPHLVVCPICDAPTGEPCKRFNRELQYPHNRRYLHAGIDYWTAPPEAP